MLNLQTIRHKSVFQYYDHEVIIQGFPGGPEEGHKKPSV